MAITILKTTVSADRRPASAGTIRVNTGAADFGASLANFGSTVNKAVSDYVTVKNQVAAEKQKILQKKKEQEYKLRSTENEAIIENSLQNVYSDILNPTGEYFNKPAEWELLYETGSEQVLEQMFTAIGDDPILKEAAINSWNKKKLQYEDKIITESFARTQANLSATILNTLETEKENLTNIDNLKDLNISIQNIKDAANSYFTSGFASADQDIGEFFIGHLSSAIEDRVLNVMSNMTNAQLIAAYNSGELQADDITSAMMAQLDEGTQRSIIKKGYDVGQEKLSDIIKMEDNIIKIDDKKFNVELNEIELEPDPVKKAAGYKKLLADNEGNEERLNIVRQSEFNEKLGFADFDQEDVSQIKFDINNLKYSSGDLAALKPRLTQTTYNELQDLLSQNILIESAPVNRLRKNIEESIFPQQEGYLKELLKSDPGAIDLYNDAVKIYVDKFNDMIIKGEQSPNEIYEQIKKEAQVFIDSRQVTNASNFLSKTTAGQLFPSYTLGVKDYEDIESFATQVREGTINYIGEDIDITLNTMRTTRGQLLQIYGDDIFSKLKAAGF